MSILDTFFILFESDASKLNKGLDESDRLAKKTTTSVKAVDDAALSLGRSFGDAIKQLGGAVLAGLTVRAMTSAMLDAVGAADKLNEATEALGLNIETVSAWGDLVKKNGGSTDGFVSSIENLNRNLSMMEVTGKSRAAPFLEELGIDLENVANKGKTAMDFLPKIADAFMGMDKQKAVAIGSKLGFDRSLVMTLQAGRKEVEALLAKEKELGVITKQQGELADKFGDQVDDMRHAFRSLWLTVSQSVLPALTWLAEKFQNVALFMRKHSDFIVGLMVALGSAILYFVIPTLFTMAGAVLVAFAPFLLVGAVIAGLAAAFALLYDDVMNFIDGNDSLIGQLLEKWPLLGDIINTLVSAVQALGAATAWTFETMFSVLQIAFNLWTRLLGAIYEFSGVGAVVNFVIDGWAGKFKGLGQIVGEVWDWIVEKIKAAIAVMSGAINLVKGIAGAITGALGGAKMSLGISSPVAEGLSAGQAALGAAGASPIASQTSNSIANSRGGDRRTSVSVGQVTVQTQATDAQGISKAIGGSMESQMRQAASNFDDGVAA